MRSTLIIAAGVFAVFGLTAAAQEKPAAQPVQEKPAVPFQPASALSTLVPLKVTVVISRLQGEKKISSLPYVLGVAANGPKTTLRMGVEVPVSTATVTTKGEAAGAFAAIPSYNYRPVGTNIDCHAMSFQGGLYSLAVTISDSSIHLDPSQKPKGSSAIVEDIPSFRNFNSSFTIVLRDGQTTQYTSATDPVTGEVMKIDVTLNVLK